MAEPTPDLFHPQAHLDIGIVNALGEGEPTDYNLAELARLRIRYRGFPGAREIQAGLDQALKRWGLSEEELFARTREIHRRGQVYQDRSSRRDDWS